MDKESHLTSFEMVMHCLKCSGKQSSAMDANMCRRFDLVIISSLRIQVVSVFFHIKCIIMKKKKKNDSACAIASVISVSC